jgi:hypothetical protein
VPRDAPAPKRKTGRRDRNGRNGAPPPILPSTSARPKRGPAADMAKRARSGSARKRRAD